MSVSDDHVLLFLCAKSVLIKGPTAANCNALLAPTIAICMLSAMETTYLHADLRNFMLILFGLPSEQE